MKFSNYAWIVLQGVSHWLIMTKVKIQQILRVIKDGLHLVGLSFLFIETKELCEARANLEMSSNLADEPTLANVLPPFKTA